MRSGRTTHRKIAATVARWKREDAAPCTPVIEDADWLRAMLARPFLSPRDKRHYAAKLDAIESQERAREVARATLASEQDSA